MTLNLKTGDTVMVLAGKDRGKKGKVTRVFREASRVIVDGVNVQKRHERPRKGGQKGQVVQFAAPVHRSNVALYCDSCGKGVRMGVKMSGDKKTRVCKKCGKAI